MKTQVTINGKTIQIELTEEQINQIKKEVNPNKRWRAKDLGLYYYVTSGGQTSESRELYMEVDDFHYNQRNYFKTQQEAQQHLDKLNLIAKIRNRIEELNGNWKPDWEDIDQNKYYIFYDVVCEFFEFSSINSYRNLEYWKYIKSKEAAQHLINEFGDKLKVLFE